MNDALGILACVRVRRADEKKTEAVELLQCRRRRLGIIHQVRRRSRGYSELQSRETLGGDGEKSVRVVVEALSNTLHTLLLSGVSSGTLRSRTTPATTHRTRTHNGDTLRSSSSESIASSGHLLVLCASCLPILALSLSLSLPLDSRIIHTQRRRLSLTLLLLRCCSASIH